MNIYPKEQRPLRLTAEQREELQTVKRLVATDSPLSHDMKVAMAGLFIAKLMGHDHSQEAD